MTTRRTSPRRTGSLLPATKELVSAVSSLRFGPPVTHVYDPLEYASKPYAKYLDRFGRGPREILLMGMNPGPWGMAQTGVPFGEVNSARDFLGCAAPVGKPPNEHPRRPITGYECHRSEVSGARIWGWVRGTFGTPERFFARFFIANYCPLAFLEETGRNRTPDKLPPAEREPLFAACDLYLRRTVEHFQPKRVIGIGRFAENRARAALGDSGVSIGRVTHPSPANPAANRNWPALIAAELRHMGVSLPKTKASR